MEAFKSQSSVTCVPNVTEHQQTPPERVKKKIEQRLEINVLNDMPIPKLFTIRGTLGDHPARILIDSGSSSNFVSQLWVNAFNVPLKPRLGGSVQFGNGNTEYIDYCVLVELKINDYRRTMQLNLVNIQPYDVILGIEWLQFTNAHINWRLRTITLYGGGKEHILKGENEYPPNLDLMSLRTSIETENESSFELCSAQQIKRASRKSDAETGLVVVKNVDKNIT